MLSCRCRVGTARSCRAVPLEVCYDLADTFNSCCCNRCGRRSRAQLVRSSSRLRPWQSRQPSIVVAVPVLNAGQAAANRGRECCVVTGFKPPQHRWYEDSSSCRRLSQNITRASRRVRLPYATNSEHKRRATHKTHKTTSNPLFGKNTLSKQM